MSNQITHKCSELKEENLLRFFEQESQVSYQFDTLGHIVFQVVGLERIRVSYCSFCGERLDSRVESIVEELSN